MNKFESVNTQNQEPRYPKIQSKEVNKNNQSSHELATKYLKGRTFNVVKSKMLKKR